MNKYRQYLLDITTPGEVVSMSIPLEPSQVKHVLHLLRSKDVAAQLSPLGYRLDTLLWLYETDVEAGQHVKLGPIDAIGGVKSAQDCRLQIMIEGKRRIYSGVIECKADTWTSLLPPNYILTEHKLEVVSLDQAHIRFTLISHLK